MSAVNRLDLVLQLLAAVDDARGRVDKLRAWCDDDSPGIAGRLDHIGCVLADAGILAATLKHIYDDKRAAVAAAAAMRKPLGDEEAHGVRRRR